MPIITSRLDTDFYKFTMQRAVIDMCSRMGIDMPIVSYKFKCRNKVNLVPLIDKIRKEIDFFKNLTFTRDECKFFSGKSEIFPEGYRTWLAFSTLRDCQVSVYQREGELNIDVEGPWCTAIEYEVPVLAIVNELYFKNKTNHAGQSNLKKFVSDMQALYSDRFIDFGTRRRFSKRWHWTCLNYADKKGILKATSNCLYAHLTNTPVRGTMAHEWIMGFQAISRNLKNFQKDALEHWMLTYRGRLDAALTDTLGINAFLKDWDGLLMKNYSTLRHDSGDPIVFMNKVIHHYKLCGIVPSLLFSDGLNPEKLRRIYDYFDEIQKNYFRIPIHIVPPGIGTFFTNNCGHEPLQIVMKLHKVNGQQVIKMSDTPGKAMGDEDAANRIIKVFDLKP